MAKDVSLQDVLSVTNRIEDKLDQIGQRVNDLESWRSSIKGQILVITAGLSVAFTMAWDYTKKKLNL